MFSNIPNPDWHLLTFYRPIEKKLKDEEDLTSDKRHVDVDRENFSEEFKTFVERYETIFLIY